MVVDFEARRMRYASRVDQSERLFRGPQGPASGWADNAHHWRQHKRGLLGSVWRAGRTVGLLGRSVCGLHDGRGHLSLQETWYSSEAFRFILVLWGQVRRRRYANFAMGRTKKWTVPAPL